MSATTLVVQGAGDLHDPEGTIVLVRYLERELPAGDRVLAPEMPGAEDDPRYEPWRDAIRDQLDQIDGPTHVVGHSFGGSVVLRMVAEAGIDPRVRSLHLIAMPWWGLEGWDWEELALPAGVGTSPPDVRIYLYHSVDDPHVPIAHLARYADALPQAVVRRIPGAKHSFRDGLPELVQDILAAGQAPRPTADR